MNPCSCPSSSSCSLSSTCFSHASILAVNSHALSCVAAFGEKCGGNTPQSWYDHAHKMGHCALCLFVDAQEHLDLHYAETHDGASRAEDPHALLFPSFGPGGGIQWSKPVSAAQFTEYTRQVILLSNRSREACHHKEAKLYTTHSAKVGGAVEFARRGCTLVEGQQFTGHMSPLCFSMYAMLMGKFDSAHTIIEMQQPPIMDAHGIKSTRELQRVSALLSSTHALFIANNPSLV